MAMAPMIKSTTAAMANVINVTYAGCSFGVGAPLLAGQYYRIPCPTAWQG